MVTFRSSAPARAGVSGPRYGLFVESQVGERSVGQAMELYGLRGITHGWGRLVTVMSPSGASAVAGHIEAGPDFNTVAVPGQLPQYHQIRDGAIEALVARYGIVMLNPEAWAAKKRELGEAVYR